MKFISTYSINESTVYHQQYFEFKDKDSSKFWEITINGKKVSIHYGKIGTAGQNIIKELDKVFDR